MRLLCTTLWVLALLLAPGFVMSQATYYWSDGRQIALTSNPKAMMVHLTETTGDLTALRAMASQPEVAEIDVFELRKRAVIHFEQAHSESPGEMARQLGFTPDQVRSVSYGWTLDDGFEVFHTHEVVLQMKPGRGLSSLQAILDQYGASYLRTDYATIVLDVPNINQVLPLANAIRESGLVDFAHPDLYAELNHTNDPLFGEQFQMHNTGQTIDGFTGTADADANALEAWGITLGSSSITVAVIDDGVEAHEDLSTPSAGFSPANGGNGTPNSSGAHGQACAGIIAGLHNGIGVQGVAPNVDLITGNIFLGGETTQDLANTITWAKNQGADVMSNSWGYSSCTFSSSTLTSALNDANSTGRSGLGCVIVFASGNDYGSCVSYPANVSSVIAVGAFGNDGIKSSYSNAGSALDLSAPSNDISSAGFLSGAGVRTVDRMGSAGYSSGNYTTSFGGTSAACPVVAGVAALVLSVDGSLNSGDVKNILYATAKDFGASGFDNSYGWGAVDAEAAVIAAGGSGGGGGGSSCSATVSSFPYGESFESGLGAWSQVSGDDLDWTRQSGGTPSSGTGPSAASDGSFYLYVETSGNGTGYPSKVAILGSACFDVSGLSSPEFTFDYHMLGSDVGTLDLQASTDGSSWTSLWSRSADQGSAWNSATVDLSAYAAETELRLRFVGTSGSSWQGDLCVDAVALQEASTGGGGGGCTGTDVTLTLVLDNYPGETTWGLTDGSGGTIASGGPYSAAGATVTETFCLADDCYDFTINDSYGDGICCAYGNGSYTLADASSNVLASGGSFASTETQNFCVGNTGTCPTLDFDDYTITAYGNGQDNGTATTQNNGLTIVLSNNAWKDISFNYTVTSNTVLEFEFGSTDQGEIHGIGFDTDEGISSNRTFQLYGTQNWGITNYSYTSIGNWQSFTIPVGNFYTGSFTKLFFVCDDDGGTSSNTYFRNLKLYEGSCGGGTSTAQLFQTPTLAQYGDEPELPAARLDLYPNPTRELLHVSYGYPDEQYDLLVTDATGRVLQQQTMAGGKQSLDLSRLSAGIYFLKVHSAAGEQVQKFVKQ